MSVYGRAGKWSSVVRVVVIMLTTYQAGLSLPIDADIFSGIGPVVGDSVAFGQALYKNTVKERPSEGWWRYLTG